MKTYKYYMPKAWAKNSQRCLYRAEYRFDKVVKLQEANGTI